MFVISVINQNGGVGKTHTANNLSMGLAKRGKSVLLIDADPQATCTDTLLEVGNEFKQEEMDLFKKKVEDGIPSFKALEDVISNEAPQYDLSHVFEEPTHINRAIYKTKFKNIDILPSSMNLDLTEQKILDDKTRSNVDRLKNALRFMEKEYDFVIIDEAPRSDLIVTNSLLVSDFVIIPVKTDRKSIKGFLRTIKAMVLIQSRNYVDFDFKLLFQMVSKNKNDKRMLEFYQENFSQYIFKQTIRYQAKPISDADLNSDFVINNERANVAKDYLSFVDELINYVESRKE